MKNNRHFGAALLLLPALLLMFACEKNGKDDPDAGSGVVSIRFVNRVTSQPLVLDTLQYVTQSGQSYKITDLQYFISKITLYRHDGGVVILSDGDSIRYVDARLPETQAWDSAAVIEAGEYDSVAFIFGLDESQNISYRFPNPPERDMFWPEVLGGGYHHMKLNSMWKSCCTNLESPFMMHLGTGQIYSGQTHSTDSIIGFVPNWFRVSLPASSFTLQRDSVITLRLMMNIEYWFNGPPNILDLSSLPQGIMQNQELMAKVRDNGKNAFSMSHE